jgi:hypothetical protein
MGVRARTGVVVAVLAFALAGCGGDDKAAAPTPTASPSPSAVATSSAPFSLPPGPDATYTLAKLGEQKMTLPTWSSGKCPQGPMKFHHGKAKVGGYQVAVTQALPMDVDGDGLKETVALFTCREVGQCETYYQASVVDRNPSGDIWVRWQVATDDDGFASIAKIRAGSSGTVDLSIAEYGTCEVASARVYQWQSYTLTELGTPYHAYTAVGGRPTFPPNPQALDIAVKLVSNSGGVIKAKISNASTFTASHVWATIRVEKAPSISATSGLSGCSGGKAVHGNAYVLDCRVADLKAGKSVTVSWRASGSSPTIFVGRYPAGQTPSSTGVVAYPDPVAGNNSTMPGLGN